MADGDLLRNVKFVKLTSVNDLPYAEAIQKILRAERIGAVIINDESVQARPDGVRAQAVPPSEGFRIEVPEQMLEKARTVLAAVRKSEESM